MDWFGFFWLLLPIALSPGASFTLALSNSLVHGLKGAMVVISATALGIMMHASLAAVGISSWVVHQPGALVLLKWIGVAFLMWLAFELLLQAVKAWRHPHQYQAKSVSFGQAWWLNMANGKALLLYLSIIPQFAAGKPWAILQMGLVHCGVMATYILLISSLLSHLRHRLHQQVLAYSSFSIGGLVLLGLAIKMALT